MEVTLTLANNNSNFLNNISQIPLPPQVPGQRPAMFSDVHLDYPPQYVPQEGKKSLSATTLQERERTPCPHTLPERVRTPCFLSPQEGERTPHFLTPQEGVKTPRSHTPQEGVKTPSVQSHIVFIQDQVQNENNLKVGSRLKLFLPVWKNLGAHHSIQNLIAEGYKLPFRERPKLSRTPCIISGFSDLNKQSALSSAIQDLIGKGAIDIVQKPDSLGFYSRLFLVPKPGNCWRPVIDLSCLNKFLAISKFKMETPESIRASLRKNEWVTSIDLTDAYLHIPIQPHSQKYLRFHHKGVSYQFTSLPFGLATAPLTFTNVVKEVRLLALQRGIRIHQYLDDWLVRAPSKEECQKQTQKLLNLIRNFGFIVNFKKSELVPSQRFDFLGYHFLLDKGLVKPTQDRWTKLQDMFRRLSSKSVISARTLMSTIGLLASMEKTVKLDRMHMRPFQWHLKTHWKYPMPLDTPIPWNQKMIRHGEWWLDPKNVLQGEFLHPREHETGRALRSRLNRRGLVSHRKSSPHQPFGIKGSSPSATVLQDHLQEQSRSHCLGQHLRSVLHKQTGWHKIRRTLRSNVENSDMVQSQQRHTQSKTHTRIPQCDSGWPLKEEPDPKHRVVPISTSFQTNIKDMGKSPSGPFCNPAERKTPLVRLSDPGSPSLGSGRLEHSMGESGCIRFSPNRPPAQGYTETPVTNVQASSDRPRLAIETMVLGPSGNVTGRTSTVTSNANLTQTTNEQHFPLQPGLPQPPRLVSRSTALQQRGFTAEVADRIAAPQRLSTRAIYTSKWSVFQRWCMEQQVDFGSPSIGDICNFFWYLFHDLNRCPSTIEGYRTAIADTLGNSHPNISSNTDIARLIASFYRDKPKKSRPLPKWDLALVLHKLTQPPFEPQEKCTLKLTTWKTVFLLALASGKRRSKIHAWTHDGTLCLGNWEQVQLTPSPSFIAKNQLAKEGPHIVSPVIIPALKSDQDSRDLDILLCPVRALKHYLDRTKDSRTGRHLLFISYKLGHSKDIQCSTISSWIKHTIQFCYSRAESTDMVLTGVKAHDVRAFAASKAFYGGTSLDQIMQACHWRSHNTFTKFYLKDLTGQDQKEGSYHLGSFVAAQQVMPPSS